MKSTSALPIEQRIRHALASPTLVRRLALIAIVLTIPALFHGFEVDDRLQRMGALGEGKLAFLSRGPFDLYTFADGKTGHTKTLMELGVATWWSDPTARLSFFRPLSSLLLWADHQFLKNPIAIHAHSVLWYVGTIFVAAALYRRLLRDAWIAGLAGLMFAVDHTHGLPAGWIAQRNTLLTGFFGLATLYFHDRSSREEGRKKDVVLASLMLGLALFSAEASLGIVPYLVAHAWVFDRNRWLRVLLPYAPPLLLWLFIYKVGQFGAHGSGLYIDPGHAPMAYLSNVVQHWPILVATELGMPGADFHPFLPFVGKVLMVLLSLAVGASFLVAIAPLWRRDPVTRFFVIGGFLAVLPGCATFPSMRLTFLSSIGLVGALAQLVAAWRDRVDWFPSAGIRRAMTMPVVFWCGLGHVFMSPFAFVFSLHQMTIFESIVERNANGLPDDPRLESQRVIVVNPPEAAFATYLMIVRTDQGRPSPGKMLSMAGGSRPLELMRTGENTVLLSSSAGFVKPGIDLLTRDDRPFVVGYRVDLSDVSVEITRVNADGFPSEARFTFAHPLEDDSYRWTQWKGQTIKPLPLPKIGEQVSFPAQNVQLF